MSFDREDCYDECRDYCQNIDLVVKLNEMIFDADYNDHDKAELVKIKNSVIRDIESFEKRRCERVLYDTFKLKG